MENQTTEFKERIVREKFRRAFSGLVGNEDIKGQLEVSIHASIKKGLPVPHILFAGAAGCGKTSMSKAIAEAMCVPYISVSPYGLRTERIIKEEIVNKLPWDGYDRHGTIIGPIHPSIVFIDEIHNLPLKGQEILGIMMECWEFAGPRVRASTIKIPRFTLVGATTMEGMLSKPMRDRFKAIYRFNTYSLSDSTEIVINYVKRNKLNISVDTATEIAKRARGVPRLIIRYVDWLIDLLLVNNSEHLGEITTAIVERGFEMMRVDERGLNEVDIKILKCLAESETPVGIDTLVVISNETSKTIEQVIEPYLIQIGFVKRTPSGRILTETGRNYMEDNGLIEEERFYIGEPKEVEEVPDAGEI